MFKKPNSVSIGGNLGADAEVKEAGTATVAKFRLANTESYKAKDKDAVETTHWFNVELWNPGGVGPLLKKGTEVVVQGTLNTSSYEKDGNTVTQTFIKADQVFLTGAKKE